MFAHSGAVKPSHFGISAIFAAALALSPVFAQADEPPARVGRISLIEGTVSFHPSPSEDWATAVLNYPVAAQTSVWAEEGARAEVEIGSAYIRLDGGTELDINQLDDQNVVLSVPQGRIDVTLRGSRPDERYDIETARGDVALADGSYRIFAGSQQDETRIAAFAGTAEITLNGQQITVAQGQEAISTTVDPATYQMAQATQDSFDQWAAQRDGELFGHPAPGPVASIPGTQSLAEYGTWRTTSEYGQVWSPANVAPDWTPYSAGSWSYVGPWGWTWVDSEPWGWAPFHYGRWAFIDGSWGWVPFEPGVSISVGYRPVWAPALVSFLGDPVSFTVGYGGPCVGWVPLGPGEFWHPWFHAGFDYVRNVNYFNVNRTVFNNINVYNYRTYGDRENFMNRRAAYVVPATAFARGERVNAAALRLNRDALDRRPLRAQVFGGEASPLPRPEPAARYGGGRIMRAPPAPGLQVPHPGPFRPGSDLAGRGPGNAGGAPVSHPGPFRPGSDLAGRQPGNAGGAPVSHPGPFRPGSDLAGRQPGNAGGAPVPHPGPFRPGSDLAGRQPGNAGGGVQVMRGTTAQERPGAPSGAARPHTIAEAPGFHPPSGASFPGRRDMVPPSAGGGEPNRQGRPTAPTRPFGPANGSTSPPADSRPHWTRPETGAGRPAAGGNFQAPAAAPRPFAAARPAAQHSDVGFGRPAATGGNYPAPAAAPRSFAAARPAPQRYEGSAPRYSPPAQHYAAPTVHYAAPERHYSPPAVNYGAPAGHANPAGRSAPPQQFSAPVQHSSAPSHAAAPRPAAPASNADRKDHR